MSAEDRPKAVTVLVAMIQKWWSKRLGAVAPVLLVDRISAWRRYGG